MALRLPDRATATVTATTNNPPTATAHNQIIAPGTAIALSSLFTYSDPDIGDAVVGFAVLDRTSGGGHLYLNGVQQSDKLASFTGFERIELNNFTGEAARLFLSSQAIAVTIARAGHLAVASREQICH